jgi:hypothetical protein
MDAENMKCYICAQEGKDSDALAICIVCGMGLCQEHIIHQEIDLWEGGYPLPSEKIKATLPRILCPYCYKALKGD